MEKLYGLIGSNIGYSFSRDYFTKKFADENLPHRYENFDIADIEKLQPIIEQNPHLAGLNVTIPYKESIISRLDCLSDDAEQIGAVNTVKITASKLEGFNTDWIGFSESLRPLLKQTGNYALILGTGGAAKAVAYGLRKLGVPYRYVSRTDDELLHYHEIDQALLLRCNIIINCTPLGTFPDIEKSPEIPYFFLNRNHVAYDLVYNPEKSSFLKQAEFQGATIKNGLEMLQIQAEEAWKIWNQ